MKLGKLIFGTLLLINASAFAQDATENRECDRMRFLAGEELKLKSYAAAASYYLKGEEICGNYDAKQYARMTGTLRNTINSTKDKAVKKLYADTLEAVFLRTEEKGFYDPKDDLVRAANILSSSSPDNKKADMLFRRGIASKGTSTNQAYITYFYYNAYVVYKGATADEQPALKKQLIADYFEMSSLVNEAGMPATTQEKLTKYFNGIVQSCDDIVPELKGYMENLPEDPEAKKATVMNFITLLDEKGCESAEEYGQLIEIYVDLDPESLDAQLMRAKYQMSKKQYSAAISTLKTAKSLATEEAQKMEITYQIAMNQLRSGSYTSAYNTAMSVEGDLRGDALGIAGRAVGNNANNCGASTFDRKCNYIYAVQLLEQARAKGADVGSAISKFKANYPTDGEVFENGSPSSVTLSCYGVSVNPKG